MKSDNILVLEQLKEEHKIEMRKLEDKYEKSQEQILVLIETTKKGQNEQWSNLKSEIIEELNNMKVDIESYNAETEDTIKTSNEELLLQIEESRLNVKNVDDKLLNSISEVFACDNLIATRTDCY